MGSGYTYPERSGNNLAEVRASAKAETNVRTKNDIMVFSEVSRGHSRPETSGLLIKQVKAKVSHKDEGLNVRKAVEIRTLRETAATTETL
jgi:hypothetical protein